MSKLPNISEAIGKNIRNARLFKRLTTKELAELSGLSPGHLQMLETGRRRINVDHIFAIAQALGVAPEKLINPDITSYFPSQRFLPLVIIDRLDGFSVCPDRDSVEKIAERACLCPPEITDPRAFAVIAAYETVFPHEELRILLCVPTTIKELPFSNKHEGAYYLKEMPISPPASQGYMDEVLVKVSGHPVLHSPLRKWRFENKNLFGLVGLNGRTEYPAFLATDKKGQPEPFVEWLCRVEGYFPGSLTSIVSTQTKPPPHIVIQ